MAFKLNMFTERAAFKSSVSSKKKTPKAAKKSAGGKVKSSAKKSTGTGKRGRPPAIQLSPAMRKKWNAAKTPGTPENKKYMAVTKKPMGRKGKVYMFLRPRKNKHVRAGKGKVLAPGDVKIYVGKGAGAQNGGGAVRTGKKAGRGDVVNKRKRTSKKNKMRRGESTAPVASKKMTPKSAKKARRGVD